MDLRISQATSRVIFQETTIADYHQHWMIQFSRVYSDESEKQMRLKIFKKNLEFIENFNNKGNQSYKLGVNEFTDLTDEEFLATNTGRVGESKDWRKGGVVTPVKKQGGCVLYIVSNRGIASDQAYPYQVKDGACQSHVKPAMQIKEFNAVQQKNERALLEAVSRQAVSVGIAARKQFHPSGVYNAGDTGTLMNHAMTLYWRAKNSWGTTRGENGYIRLRRDVEWPQGMCGVAQYAFILLD
ncbi:hypothetical protein BRARA_G00781 [Brassica rapa]|uniref:Cathepsin propeptide inhibitor domain-containing protein n=1 Tax=Brassica campestris TaxID=3711 RepID=A0A397YIU6_BRACM|nr:hypothetical protein BRARA_G00781 [Brassica rapa]